MENYVHRQNFFLQNSAYNYKITIYKTHEQKKKQNN